MKTTTLLIIASLTLAVFTYAGVSMPEKEEACCPPADSPCCPATGDTVNETGVSENKPVKEITVDFLYLDVKTCERCAGSDSGLDEAVAEATPVLASMGIELTVNKIHVQSEEQARELRFRASPTIRVNGADIAPDIVESSCDDCGDICGDAVDCREWEYNGKTYDIPPKALILDAIFKSIYADTVPDDKPYDDVPENLKRFFEGIGEK